MSQHGTIRGELHGPVGQQIAGILGDEHVPLLWAVPTPIVSTDEGPILAYFVDLAQLSREQMDAVVAYCGGMYDLSPDDVRAELAVAGLPIMAHDIGRVFALGGDLELPPPGGPLGVLAQRMPS
jgi:hypothetical protein